MTIQEAKTILDALETQCRSICDIAKTASKNSKSLTGENNYGSRFHSAVVAVSKIETNLRPILTAAGAVGNDTQKLSDLLNILKDPKSALRKRNDALKQLQMVCQATILPALEALNGNPVPKTEQILPLDVVRPTRRKYLERIVTQANGTYENQWYDACGVMIRRLVETLIIELYEAKGRESEIKDCKTTEFMMLSNLVDVLLADKSWNLMRDTKKILPEIKILGDRSAHARRYNTTKVDVEKIIPGLRMVVDDLLHLSGLK